MTKFWFKHAYWGNDWQEYKRVVTNWTTAGNIAEQIAEDSWNEEPRDPYAWSFGPISIKDEAGIVSEYTVTAEAEVHFSARKNK